MGLHGEIISRSKVWTRSNIEIKQKQIDGMISVLPDDFNARLEFFRENLRRLESAISDEELVEKLLFTLSALAQNVRYEFFSNHEFKNSIRVVEAILKLKSINPLESNLSFLHSQLRYTISQTYRRDGDHLLSVWYQFSGIHFDKTKNDNKSDYDIFRIANRYLRAGHSKDAIKLYERVEALETSKFKIVSRLSRIKALRLSGQTKLANEVWTTTELSNMSEELHAEFDWEKLCLEYCDSQNVVPLVTAVKKNPRLSEASYILEAILWCSLGATRENRDVLPSIPRIKRLKSLNPMDYEHLIECIEILDEAYGTVVPFSARLESIGFMLSRATKLISVDWELLLFAAAVKWLQRGKAHPFACYALRHYQALSMRLSDGASLDVLNAMQESSERYKDVEL